MDITGAFITSGWSGVSPMRVLQAVASGLLGTSSYQGGYATAALGLLLHFFIAFGATVVFYLASHRLKFLVNQAVVSGILYGVAVYFFMKTVVLPLSAFPHPPSWSFGVLASGIIVHILCVGLPIALITRKFAK